jgi:hypothetical protein
MDYERFPAGSSVPAAIYRAELEGQQRNCCNSPLIDGFLVTFSKEQTAALGAPGSSQLHAIILPNYPPGDNR